MTAPRPRAFYPRAAPPRVCAVLPSLAAAHGRAGTAQRLGALRAPECHALDGCAVADDARVARQSSASCAAETLLQPLPVTCPLAVPASWCAHPHVCPVPRARPLRRRARAQPGLDDLGDDEEAESQLFSLLQRLRFAGTEAGASFGLDLCELALAVGASQLEDADTDAGATEAEAERGDKAASADASPAPKRNRAAARQRARFVKALLTASLTADEGEPGPRGADGPP